MQKLERYLEQIGSLYNYSKLNLTLYIIKYVTR